MFTLLVVLVKVTLPVVLTVKLLVLRLPMLMSPEPLVRFTWAKLIVPPVIVPLPVAVILILLLLDDNVPVILMPEFVPVVRRVRVPVAFQVLLTKIALAPLAWPVKLIFAPLPVPLPVIVCVLISVTLPLELNVTLGVAIVSEPMAPEPLDKLTDVEPVMVADPVMVPVPVAVIVTVVPDIAELTTIPALVPVLVRVSEPLAVIVLLTVIAVAVLA